MGRSNLNLILRRQGFDTDIRMDQETKDKEEVALGNKANRCLELKR